MSLARAFVIFMLALPASAQSSLPPEVVLLARIRNHNAPDLSHLPNFTCLETIERATRTSASKPFAVRDIVHVEVALVDGRELFAWPGASSFEDRPLSQLLGAGLTSSGEYSQHARSLFVNSSAVIHYSNEEDIGGHHAVRYDYEISPAFSGYEVAANGKRGVAGVRGSFWADKSTLDLLRLTVEGVDIPDDLGIWGLLTTVDYGRLHIGSGDYLLPQSAGVWVALETGRESRNRVDFTHCRQYVTESAMSFGEALPGQPPQRAPVEFTIPEQLTISLRLQKSIRIQTAKVGDPISAELASDVRDHGQLIAPRGAVVSGRLRILQNDGEQYAAGIEFTDLASGDRHARFIGRLVYADPTYAHMTDTSSRVTVRPHAGGTLRTLTTITEAPPQLPGVGTFFIAAGVTQLPKGMLMEWKTIGLAKDR